MKQISKNTLILLVVVIVIFSSNLNLGVAYGQSAADEAKRLTDKVVSEIKGCNYNESCITGVLSDVRDQIRGGPLLTPETRALRDTIDKTTTAIESCSGDKGCIDRVLADNLKIATPQVEKVVETVGSPDADSPIETAFKSCHFYSLMPCVFASVYAVMYIAGKIAGLIFILGGHLIDMSLNLNSTLLDEGFVKVGWTLVRDLANLGLVLALIIIALATILRFQQYGASQTLVKLIVVALLINFSLTLAGVFMDLAGVISNFFATALHLDSDTFATQIADAFNVQSLLNASAKGVAGSNTLLIISLIASLFFVVIFTLIAAITMFGIAVMFLVRYAKLIIYLVLSPLAMFAMILPFTRSKWEDWFKGFTSWTFFAPASLFFIWLTISVIEGLSIGRGPGNVDAVAAGLAVDNSVAIIAFAKIASNMVLICVLLVAGLIAAQKAGVTIADTFIGYAKGAARGVGKYGRDRTRSIAGGTGGVMNRFGNAMSRVGSGSNSRFVRGITSPFRGAGTLIGGAGKGIDKATGWIKPDRAPNFFQSVKNGILSRGDSKYKSPESRKEQNYSKLEKLQGRREKFEKILGRTTDPGRRDQLNAAIASIEKDIADTTQKIGAGSSRGQGGGGGNVGNQAQAAPPPSSGTNSSPQRQPPPSRAPRSTAEEDAESERLLKAYG